MTSPLARGLFRRAIIQSAGSPLKSLGGSMTQKMAEENGLAVEKIAGCGLEKLQKMDPMELLRIGREVLVMIEGKVADENAYVGRTYKDAPNVDGLIFINTEAELMSGDFARVKVTGALEYDLIGELME